MFQHPALPFVLSILFAASCMSVRRLFGLVSSFRASAIALRICFPVTALSTSTASSLNFSLFVGKREDNCSAGSRFTCFQINAVQNLGLVPSKYRKHVFPTARRATAQLETVSFSVCSALRNGAALPAPQLRNTALGGVPMKMVDSHTTPSTPASPQYCSSHRNCCRLRRSAALLPPAP